MNFDYMEYAFKSLEDIKDEDAEELEEIKQVKTPIKESKEEQEIAPKAKKQFRVFTLASDDTSDLDYVRPIDFASKEEAEAYADEMKSVRKFKRVVVKPKEEVKPITESIESEETKKEQRDTTKQVTVDVNTPDKEEVEQAQELLDSDTDEEEQTTQVVLDVDADNLSEVETKSYIGKYIIKCPVCDTLIYKDLEELHKSEEKDVDGNPLFNIDEECPHCHAVEEGFIVVGQVGKADFDADEIKEHVEVEESIEEPKETLVEETEEVKESLVIDDFDSFGFDSIIDNYLKESTEEEHTFITTSCQQDNDTFIVEGLLDDKEHVFTFNTKTLNDNEITLSDKESKVEACGTLTEGMLTIKSVKTLND